MDEFIIVSDLHLGEGEQSPHEDFFFDEHFTDFLKHYGKKNETLIINGDFVDFLQITDKGNFHPLTRNERRFGLGTEPRKSAYKLSVAMKMHAVFFDALYDFAARGNKILIIKGNHDVEFYWPQVRKVFYDELLKRTDSLSREKNRNTDTKATKKRRALILKNIIFLPWFHYVPGLLYVEHGNQYDPVNAFAHFLCPLLSHNKKQLDIPLGSFFVRYFFNLMEKTDPLADNFKPPSAYLWHVLQTDPLRFVKLLATYLPCLVRVWIKYHKRPRYRGTELRKRNEAEMKKVATYFKIPSENVASLGELQKESIMQKRFFWLNAIRSSIHTDFPPYLPIATKIQKLLKVKYVVFGHTHDAHESQMLFNTGTWTTLVNPKQHTIKGKRLTYVHISGKRAELKEWA